MDKQIREKVLQYNLKHPPTTQQISTKNESKTRQQPLQDPDLNGIQESKTVKVQNIKDLTKSQLCTPACSLSKITWEQD